VFTSPGVTVAAPFSLSANTCAGATVAPNASCNVSVVFSPTVAQAYTGSLTVATNAGTAGAVTLAGLGQVGALVKTLDFETWPTYNTAFFTVTGNSSAAPSWLGGSNGLALVTPLASNNGRFSVVFVIPAGATAASVTLSAWNLAYGNNINLAGPSGAWTISNGSMTEARTYALVPGAWLISTSTANGANACPFAWCANSISTIDNISVRFTP
jgi:hypothetical protein